MEGNNNRAVIKSKKRCNGSSKSNEQTEMQVTQTNKLNNGKHEEVRRGCFPPLFERSKFGLFNPSFDSVILEKHFEDSFALQRKHKFRSALVYVCFSCVVWVIFFGASHMEDTRWVEHIIGSCILLTVTALFLVPTYYDTIYAKHYTKLSVIFALILCLFSLLRYVYMDFQNSSPLKPMAMSSLGSFCSLIEIILLLYNLIPLPLYLALGISLAYSIIYEVLFLLSTPDSSINFKVGTVLLHVCVHLLCLSLYLMATVRKHATFSRIGQSAITRRDLILEKQQQVTLIYSLMPVKVANEALTKTKKDDNNKNTGDRQESEDGAKEEIADVRRNEIVFRQFNVDKMSHVSILFADIVGFTKMSSNKTAEQLLELLNELFGEFDKLSAANACEKISTLGDCYYCVSGCPVPVADHAQNCVRLGLDMVEAIRAFDEKHNEEVNMRVGIHTGTVLCGIVGTRRFKFDVWSHDVDLANAMESTGEPGRVHISQKTKDALFDTFLLEQGESVKDTKIVRNLTEQFDHETSKFGVRQNVTSGVTETYFILGPNPNPPKRKKEGENTDEGEGSSTQSNGSTTHIENGVAVPDSKEEETVDLILADKEEQEMDRKPLEKMEPQVFSGQQDRKLLRSVSDFDLDLVLAMKEQDDGKYFFNPPVNKVTMNFKEPSAEKSYRTHTAKDFLSPDVPKSFASSRYNVLLDIYVSTAFYILLEIIMAVVYGGDIDENPAWLIYLVVSLVFMAFQAFVITVAVCRSRRAKCSAVEKGKIQQPVSKFNRFVGACYSWIMSHILGVVQLSIPIGVVFSRYSCYNMSPVMNNFLPYALLTAIVHSINFNQLNNVMKSVIATMAGVALVVVGNIGACHPSSEPEGLSRNLELIVNVLLLLILVWFLNREIELMTRLAYNGDMQATSNEMQLEHEKETVDSLLHDILPVHVADVLKIEHKYSQSHTDVGVVFISITNFDDFYDESFEGGKEFLRVLNELFMDYEALFDEPAFKDIEKIKTIGSTFMAASGLDQASRDANANPKDHLYALMDFCHAVLKTVETFNEGMFNFDFTMKVGYNVGEVVSGVLGTSKLHFDIWGNTVNVASRMYSTGVNGKVQVTEETAKMLEDKYEFEYRDTIFIKGKGMMRTYLANFNTR